jgi:hypothetical protein
MSISVLWFNASLERRMKADSERPMDRKIWPDLDFARVCRCSSAILFVGPLAVPVED